MSEIETVDPTPHRETVDVAVDDQQRIARVHIDTGDHRIHLAPQKDVLAGTRDGAPIEAPWGPQMHLDYFTPVTNAITSRRLPDAREIEVVNLQPVTLEPGIVRQRYEPLGSEDVDTPVGRFRANRWRFTWDDYHADIWVAGDVVVAYEGLFDLIHYEPGTTGAVPT